MLAYSYNNMNCFRTANANNPGIYPQTIVIFIMGMTDGSNTGYFGKNFAQYNSNPYYMFEELGGNVLNTTTKTAIQLMSANGSVPASGTASLYGLSS
jgi:hypothetical protein